MHWQSLVQTKKLIFSTLLIISILVVVPLSFGISSARFETINTEQNSFNQTDLELDKIENLDFSTQSEISEELRSTIDATMSQFSGGFRENQNLDSGVKYLLSSSDIDMRFLESKVQLRIPNYDQSINNEQIENRLIKGMEHSMVSNFVGFTTTTLEFVDSNPVEPIAESILTSRFNYFFGSDADKWITNVPSYGELIYKNLYDNIDLIYSLKDGQLKYDFYVFPGGNYEDIQLRWNGPISLQQSRDGLQITVSTLFGEKSFMDGNPINFLGAPYDKYEEQIFGTFRLINENTYGFSIEDYDPSEILIIDPVIEFSTFLGGENLDIGYSLAIDNDGNVYITGLTIDGITDFPVTPGVYDETQNGMFDVFVTKLAANGSTVLFSTFLGGEDLDIGHSIAIDKNGDIYITGQTTDSKSGFPITADAIDETHNGLVDAFVTKLSANGSTLLFSTFLGGADLDYGVSLAIDNDGNAHITGWSREANINFPTTANAYNETHNGAMDVFVSKLDSIGSTLLYSTFLGGLGVDIGSSIAIDEKGNAYITGYTEDNKKGFPITAGAYDETPNGLRDVFVSKLAVNGSTLLFSTYLGGADLDISTSLAIDNANNVYITGYTHESTINFPTTLGAYNETHNGEIDVFVTKLAADGSTLIFSTFLGGSYYDYGQSLAIDSNGTIYITGYTHKTLTTDFPTTTGAYNETHNGRNDVFVTKLAANGSTLLYSTVLGGSHEDYGYSLAIDINGSVYITGYTYNISLGFPITAGAYNEIPNGGGDAFIIKLNLIPNSPTEIVSSSTITSSTKTTDTDTKISSTGTKSSDTLSTSSVETENSTIPITPLVLPLTLLGTTMLRKKKGNKS